MPTLNLPKTKSPKPVVKNADQLPDMLKLAPLKSKMTERDINYITDVVRIFNKYGSLTDKQFTWVKSIIARCEQGPQTPEVAIVDVIDVSGILLMFANASMKLKRVKITLQDSTAQKVVFKKAGEFSKYAGHILITDGGKYGQNKFFGTISSDGRVVPTRYMTDTIKDLIKEFSLNPEAVAAASGKLTGSCCFCSKPLDDERSLEVGYGPICAKHYGLAWGKK
jgi:hypothetical protein